MWWIALIFFAMGCQSTKSLSLRERRSLHDMVDASPILRKSFTGFALYDPASGNWLYQKDADKYYTPASNTKILTLYTALEVLGDTFPILHYELRQDSLIFWGSGNPAFLDPTLPFATDALAFLKTHPGPLFYTNGGYSGERFGSGWAWDDYPYYYQPEKAAMPLYGNLVQFSKSSGQSPVEVWPHWFGRFLTIDDQIAVNNSRPIISREEFGNHFRLDPPQDTTLAFHRWYPFHYQPEVVLGLLRDTLQRNIYYLPNYKKTVVLSLVTPTPDTLYRKLMQQSDNFIAEQLLLMCSDKLFGEMSTRRIIDYAQKNLLAEAPDHYEWVDGSGLSRYNLFTPRSVVFVLEKLYRKRPAEWLFQTFPSGGKNGTIEGWYAPTAGESSFVFAKTGSLRHRHCLSGYVLTRSGRTLIFSFMHNNFTSSSNDIKKEMDRVLRWIHESL
ncbi:MAG: D-alanyl-D-alanine carboxypeptidase [Lewinella sp.]|nr:D-alanyl-D-alanine carboxypeptidase [Lewinella sp.]